MYSNVARCVEFHLRPSRTAEPRQPRHNPEIHRFSTAQPTDPAAKTPKMGSFRQKVHPTRRRISIHRKPRRVSCEFSTVQPIEPAAKTIQMGSFRQKAHRTRPRVLPRQIDAACTQSEASPVIHRFSTTQPADLTIKIQQMASFHQNPYPAALTRDNIVDAVGRKTPHRENRPSAGVQLGRAHSLDQTPGVRSTQGGRFRGAPRLTGRRRPASPAMHAARSGSERGSTTPKRRLASGSFCPPGCRADCTRWAPREWSIPGAAAWR